MHQIKRKMVITEAILNDFRQGKIESLYTEVYPSLILYASRCLGDDYAFLAEDCVQDTIYKVYGLRDSFQTPAHFKSYLYNSIHNAAVSILRKGNSRRNYLSSQQELATDLHDAIIEQETIDLLYDAISHLPPELHSVFSLSFEQGLKNEEVAERLGCSVSTVKNRKNSILASLRRHVSLRQLIVFLSLMG